MSEKKPLNRAVKDDHFDVRVSFQRCDDFIELRNSVWAKDVEWRGSGSRAPKRRRRGRAWGRHSGPRAIRRPLPARVSTPRWARLDMVPTLLPRGGVGVTRKTSKGFFPRASRPGVGIPPPP